MNRGLRRTGVICREGALEGDALLGRYLLPELACPTQSSGFIGGGPIRTLHGPRVGTLVIAWRLVDGAGLHVRCGTGGTTYPGVVRRLSVVHRVLQAPAQTGSRVKHQDTTLKHFSAPWCCSVPAVQLRQGPAKVGCRANGVLDAMTLERVLCVVTA